VEGVAVSERRLSRIIPTGEDISKKKKKKTKKEEGR